MPIVLQSYRPEHEPSVNEFNQRLRSAGADADLVFYESAEPRWLPATANPDLYNEFFLALDNGTVRGGYALKHQMFSFADGSIREVGYYHHPLSESIVNQAHAIVGDVYKRQEVTRGQPGASITALGFMKEEGTANHLVFDRLWMHGTAQDETTRGLALRGMTYVAVVDSFFSDFHCVSKTGSCTDSQTIVSGGGDEPEGPFKIVNNFLEASGENLMFGGGAATITPTDIEIRHNHLFKPMIWKEGAPGFVGGASGRPFIVKNHFELKNAQRVLFEGNILENAWGGFSQMGFSILLTPKNQGNHCPKCQVTDVTLRYNRIRSVGGCLLYTSRCV